MPEPHTLVLEFFGPTPHPAWRGRKFYRFLCPGGGDSASRQTTDESLAVVSIDHPKPGVEPLEIPCMLSHEHRPVHPHPLLSGCLYGMGWLFQPEDHDR